MSSKRVEIIEEFHRVCAKCRLKRHIMAFCRADPARRRNVTRVVYSEVNVLTGADAGEILTLQRAAYLSEARLHGDYSIPALTQTLAELEAELADASVIALGIRSGGRLVASVRLRVRGTTAELGRLTVVPDLQGRGLGTRLLAAVDGALPAQVERIELFTGEKSTANIRLYERMGYVEDRRASAGAYDMVFLSRPPIRGTRSALS